MLGGVAGLTVHATGAGLGLSAPLQLALRLATTSTACGRVPMPAEMAGSYPPLRSACRRCQLAAPSARRPEPLEDPDDRRRGLGLRRDGVLGVRHE